MASPSPPASPSSSADTLSVEQNASASASSSSAATDNPNRLSPRRTPKPTRGVVRQSSRYMAVQELVALEQENGVGDNLAKFVIREDAPDDDIQKRLLAKIYRLYHDPDDGLLEMAHELGEEMLPPRERIQVMLIGNHSAGKSSFINWYIGETVQKEAVGMETSGLSFICHGRKRDTFYGRATQRHVKYIDGIEQFEGLLPNLSTEVTTSRERNFLLVDFIDTPGLTDGHLKYPFDINNILLWLAQRVDVVFVFFDPHGQATCERTNTVVRELNKTCKDKLYYFLTRCDEIPTEMERMKVMVQLSQSLSRSVAESSGGTKYYGEHALEIQTIYRPDYNKTIKPEDDFNQIDNALEIIDDHIRANVQTHIEKLEPDCKRLRSKIEANLRANKNNMLFNTRISTLATIMRLLAVALPTMFIAYMLYFTQALLPEELLQHQFVSSFFFILKMASIPMMDLGTYRFHVLATMLAVYLICSFGVGVVLGYRRHERTPAELARYQRWHELLNAYVDKDGLHDQLWRAYFHDSTYQQPLI